MLYLRSTSDAQRDLANPHSYHNHYDDELGDVKEKLDGLCMFSAYDCVVDSSKIEDYYYSAADLDRLLADIARGVVRAPFYHGGHLSVWEGDDLGKLPYEGGNLVRPIALLWEAV